MAVSVNVSRFDGVTMAPPDPILGVSEAFRADTSDLKLNLGVGAYRTEELQPYVLNVVKKSVMVKSEHTGWYRSVIVGFRSLPPDSDPVSFDTGSSDRYCPVESGPCNHKNIFNDARVPWSEYRYYDPRTVGLDFDGMVADIKVMLNAYSVRLFVRRGFELLVAQSYSKNLGLYAERIGAINVVCSSPDAGTRVKSQLKRLARPMYSNPPVHGARIVANVVGDPNLFNEWKQEMELMAGRIKNVRQRLYENLSQKDESGKDWSFVLKQIGMFSYTGLNKVQGRGNDYGDADNKEGQQVRTSNRVWRGREVGARQAARSGEGWLWLRWLQREEDEEGTVGGNCGSKGVATATTEAQMRCGNKKRRRRYCASTGKELATTAKQRRQRGSSGRERRGRSRQRAAPADGR
ncbi:hypothetical protein B296_00001996 [Ensete ventricosum]|uniref:Aspartate aminotransferase n=1 Tax=Ensete ventricosum TaxID=4639 RepID=A0A427B6C8_ENSVE|nr:hypothetical protein B296_00001996 [Ensete ventricosum]